MWHRTEVSYETAKISKEGFVQIPTLFIFGGSFRNLVRSSISSKRKAYTSILAFSEN